MKIHPLRIGRTKVPFGQFYGGLEHYSCAGFASDKNQFIWLPMHAFLPRQHGSAARTRAKPAPSACQVPPAG
jgi:hypothetical protein